MNIGSKPLAKFAALLLVVSALFAMPMVHLHGTQDAVTTASSSNASIPCDSGHTTVDGHCDRAAGCMYCAAMPRNAGSLRKSTGILLSSPILSLHGASVPPDHRPPKQSV